MRFFSALARRSWLRRRSALGDILAEAGGGEPPFPFPAPAPPTLPAPAVVRGAARLRPGPPAKAAFLGSPGHREEWFLGGAAGPSPRPPLALAPPASFLRRSASRHRRFQGHGRITLAPAKAPRPAPGESALARRAAAVARLRRRRSASFRRPEALTLVNLALDLLRRRSRREKRRRRLRRRLERSGGGEPLPEGLLPPSSSEARQRQRFTLEEEQARLRLVGRPSREELLQALAEGYRAKSPAVLPTPPLATLARAWNVSTRRHPKLPPRCTLRRRQRPGTGNPRRRATGPRTFAAPRPRSPDPRPRGRRRRAGELARETLFLRHQRRYRTLRLPLHQPLFWKRRRRRSLRGNSRGSIPRIPRPGKTRRRRELRRRLGLWLSRELGCGDPLALARRWARRWPGTSALPPRPPAPAMLRPRPSIPGHRWPRPPLAASPGELAVWGPGGIINGTGDVPRWAPGGGATFGLTPRIQGHILGRALGRARNRAWALGVLRTPRQALDWLRQLGILLRRSMLLERLLHRLPRRRARRLVQAAYGTLTEVTAPRRRGPFAEDSEEIFRQWYAAAGENPAGAPGYRSSAEDSSGESSGDGVFFAEDFPWEEDPSPGLPRRRNFPFAGDYLPGAGEDFPGENTTEGISTWVVATDALSLRGVGGDPLSPENSPGDSDAGVAGEGGGHSLAAWLTARAGHPLRRTLPWLRPGRGGELQRKPLPPLWREALAPALAPGASPDRRGLLDQALGAFNHGEGRPLPFALATRRARSTGAHPLTGWRLRSWEERESWRSPGPGGVALGSHWTALAEDRALLAALAAGAPPYPPSGAAASAGETALDPGIRSRRSQDRHPAPTPNFGSGLRTLRSLLPTVEGRGSAAGRRGTLPAPGHSGPGGGPPAPSPLPPAVVQRRRGSPPSASAAAVPALGPAFGEDYRRRQGPRDALAAFYQGKERQRARDDLPAYDEAALDRALRRQDVGAGAEARARAPDALLDHRLTPAPARD